MRGGYRAALNLSAHLRAHIAADRDNTEAGNVSRIERLNESRKHCSDFTGSSAGS